MEGEREKEEGMDGEIGRGMERKGRGRGRERKR